MRTVRRSFAGRRSNAMIVGLALLAGLLTGITPLGDGVDRILSSVRSAVVHRAASGNVVIVEMDARSAARIGRWPWSRTYYAHAIDRLRAAGATTIVFDVDVSSRSDAAGDAAMAAALARADGRVALPTFGQAAGSGEKRTIDALPLPLFRPHVALASVNMAPDQDGQVRAMPFATLTAGIPRPTLSTYIAQRSGVADADFPIDLSIDPASIPRLSFIDVASGKFDPALVRGRNVLIGATAIEMGDRYAVPGWGVIPGVVVQAMAAETLLRGVPINGAAATLAFVGALGAIAVAMMRTGRRIGIALGIATAVVIGAALVAQHAAFTTYPLAPALAVLVAAGLGAGVREVAVRFRVQRTTDEATGLPNARSLLATAAAGDGRRILAVVRVNNHDALLAVLGTSRTDDALVRTAERLALPAEGGCVYRTADQQLGFFLPPDEPTDDLLDGLRAILLQPVEVAGRRVDVSVSVGVAAGLANDLERLMIGASRAAEEALRTDAFWCRHDADDPDLEASISLMGELDDAIAAGQIEVFYQPKYDLRVSRITSMEALVRWRHPERGFVGPDSFIPLAEKTNRIGPMTLHVLKTVVRDLSLLRIDHPELTAAINISAKLLSSATFNAEVERIVGTSGLPTSALVFEVTESATMSDPANAVAALNRYRELGIAVSMDDYGTGQSTLTYIRQLPLNELKIDRSFVQHVHLNQHDAVLVRSTITLAHELGLKVVAEGVEDALCLAFLREAGCDMIQGYFISRPLPLEQLVTQLAGVSRLAA